MHHTALNARIRKHALGRLNFTAAQTDVPAARRLAACKTYLRLESAMTRMRHDAGESGLAIARARAATIDAMLAHLFDYALASWKRLAALRAEVTSNRYQVSSDTAPQNGADVNVAQTAKSAEGRANPPGEPPCGTAQPEASPYRECPPAPAAPAPAAPEVTLVALGGYGRAQLNPLSDVDIMFLYPSTSRPDAIKPFQEHLVNEILYILWDCGLKVGHSSRTIDEAFALARDDIPTKTSLMEARRVAGSAALFDSFTTAYETYYRNEDVLAYIATRLKNQATRRAKYGGTVFLQEPDIKNGVGGLRDYHSVLWLAHVRLGIHAIDELAGENYLRRNDLRDFKRSFDFLMRVRNELHFTVRRPTDLLDLEQQPRVALGLGYTNHDPLARVEQFMRDYYRAAQCIHRVAKIVERRLSLTSDPATAPNPAVDNDDLGIRNLTPFAEKGSGSVFKGSPSLRESLRLARHQKTSRVDGFIHRGNELVAERPDIFREDPARLIRVFRHCQQYGAQPDFALQALIRDSLPLLNRRVQNSPECASAFRSILHTAGAVYPALSLMHELGVLGRYIPEFDTLTCLVQHEYYHRYTADIHTLNAIRELDRVFLRDEDFTGKYLDALHETRAPTLLYLILLLHDIGKADGVKGHAENGAIMAAVVLERLRVEPTMRPLVTFLIRHHLTMARFWQRRDVDDPQTAIAFAETIQNADNLHYLYVLTFCDSRSTSAQLWNSYKDSLHTVLYRATNEHLSHDTATIAEKNTERAQAKLNQLLAEKPDGIAPGEITAHYACLPEHYFIQTDPAEIALHIRMVARFAAAPAVDWRDDLNRALSIVNVVTSDRPGLFYRLAGALSVAGVNILGAKIITRTDHIAIDTFYVVEPGGGAVQNQNAAAIFEKTIAQALAGDRDLYPDIVEQARKHAARTAAANAIPGVLQHTFEPVIDVYHEPATQRTIVEIQARDQIGLLYRIAKTISDHAYDITFARVATERGIAIDTFYIEDANRAAATIDEPRLRELQDALTVVAAPA